MSFAGRVAVLTGGASGIGLAVAKRLAGEGAFLLLAGRDVAAGEEAVELLTREGAEAGFIRTDVSRREEVASLMQTAAEIHGRIDFLFNDTGSRWTGLVPFADQQDDAWESALGANVMGLLHCFQQALPLLRRAGGGVVVNAASAIGTVASLPDAMAYGATQAAVLSLTRSIAAGYAASGIRSYALCPWITDTPVNERSDLGAPSGKRALASQLNPSGRLVPAADVAEVAARLFASRSGYASGDAVLVDFGGVCRRVSPLQA